jgi:3-dehydroquinate dehydratase-1
MKIAIVYQFKNDFDNLKNFQIEAKKNDADIIEIRIDYTKSVDFTLSDLVELKNVLELPTIITIRVPSEGGVNEFAYERKLSLWKKSFEMGFEYIDIELETVIRNEIDINNLKGDSKSKLILSYHDFDSDDTFENLVNYRNEMYELGADIAKLVVMYQNENTNEVILNLIEDARKMDKEIIAIAMGEKGRITRLEGLKRGAFLTFATLGDVTTAPGQCSCREVREYLDDKGI